MLQAEVERLERLMRNLLREAELQASIESAQQFGHLMGQERDAILAGNGSGAAQERERIGTVMADLNRRYEELASNYSENEQKTRLLDEANVTMADMLRTREAAIASSEQKIQELSGSMAQVNTDASSKLAELERRHATESSDAMRRIEDLQGQWPKRPSRRQRRLAPWSRNWPRNRIDAAPIAELEQKLKLQEGNSAKIQELEKRIAANSEAAAARVAQLEGGNSPRAKRGRRIEPSSDRRVYEICWKFIA